MAITFNRDPLGWVHPFHKRRQQLMDELNEFFKSSTLAPLKSFNDLLELDTVIDTPGVTNKPDKFEMKLDVQQFAPKELDVKLVDNFLIVEGKHEEKQDEHGFVSRHFMRKYLLPSDVKPETITCDLSSDGVLNISAPKPKQIEAPKAGEKLIPIKYTGLPAITDAKSKGRQMAAAC